MLALILVDIDNNIKAKFWVPTKKDINTKSLQFGIFVKIKHILLIPSLFSFR